MKDVKLPDNPARKELLLDKHADYIEAFERDKDDWVAHLFVLLLLCLSS